MAQDALGRRQTCQKELPDHYEFSIRTPVTPARWADYEQARAGRSRGSRPCEHAHGRPAVPHRARAEAGIGTQRASTAVQTTACFSPGQALRRLAPARGVVGRVYIYPGKVSSHPGSGPTPGRAAQELAAAWEALVAALAAGDRPAAARAALGFAYVWYNFMPLARGTAVVGYITLLAVFLAAGMPVTAPIPEARTRRRRPSARAPVCPTAGSVTAEGSVTSAHIAAEPARRPGARCGAGVPERQSRPPNTYCGRQPQELKAAAIAKHRAAKVGKLRRSADTGRALLRTPSRRF